MCATRKDVGSRQHVEHRLKMDIGELVENTDQNNCTGNCNQGRNCDCLQSNSGWRLLVEKYDKLLNTQYESCHGDVYTFFGLVHASDDYYFGMSENSTKKVILLSCVGDIEYFGFKVYGEK